MRVLAIADVADKRLWDMLDRRLLEGVELVLSCGDLPAEYLSFLTCFTRAPILYVRGNHDDRYFKKPPEGCECAEDRIINVGGVRVLGLGGSMRYRESECMFTEREMKARIRRLYWKLRKSGGFDILLTHAPALDFGDGDIEETATAIDNVEQTVRGNATDAWFTLDGRKLSGKPAAKGIYIRSGRKVVVD